jgi:hypothetical protein
MRRPSLITWNSSSLLPKGSQSPRTTTTITPSGSNPDAALTAHLHTQATGLQNIRSVITIVLEPSSPDYKRWCDLVLLTLCRYALDGHVLSDVADPSIYWTRLDSIVVTWILSTLRFHAFK